MVLGTWKFQTTLPEGIASTCQKKSQQKSAGMYLWRRGALLSYYHYLEKYRIERKGNEVMKHSSPVRTQPWAKTYAESLYSKTPRCLHGFSKGMSLLVTGEVTG